MNKRVTSFYIETLILIVIFIAVILALTQVFGLAKKQSEEAKLLTGAVTLAQNAAEAFSAADSEETLFALLDEGGNADRRDGMVTASYGADMKPDPDGILRVEIERISATPQTAAGTIRVIRQDTGEEIYSIETAAYFPEDYGK